MSVEDFDFAAEFATTTFALVGYGDGRGVEIVSGWTALVEKVASLWINFGELTAEERAEAQGMLTDPTEWGWSDTVPSRPYTVSLCGEAESVQIVVLPGRMMPAYEGGDCYWQDDEPETACSTPEAVLTNHDGWPCGIEVVCICASVEIGQRWGFAYPPPEDAADPSDLTFWFGTEAEAKAALARMIAAEATPEDASPHAEAHEPEPA